MTNVKFHLKSNEDQNFLAFSANLTDVEVERLTPGNRLYLGQNSTSDQALLNCPIAEIGRIE